MANSADPDQLASSEANWFGFTLFANAGYIRVQQDKGLGIQTHPQLHYGKICICLVHVEVI